MTTKSKGDAKSSKLGCVSLSAWQTSACLFQAPCYRWISVTESRANRNHQEHKHLNLLTTEGVCLEQQREHLCIQTGEHTHVLEGKKMKEEKHVSK